MGYMTRDYELLRAHTAIGAGTVTNVQGATWVMFQTYGFINATSTYVRPEANMFDNQWVNVTVLDLNNNVATTVVATNSIYRFGEMTGVTAFRLRLATLNGTGASVTAVSRVGYDAG